MILDNIIIKKKTEIKELKKNKFKDINKSKRDFKRCIKGIGNIIAEVKRKSPSKGVLNNNLDIKDTTQIYDRYANAISVVTDNEFFGGKILDIREIKKYTKLPVLRKDFIIDKIQVIESRFYGADAILLIASLLSKKNINEFIDLARKYDMDCVIEVHSKKELEKVLNTKAEIIGINNRNLRNFNVDINVTNELIKLIPEDIMVISESGFNSFSEIKNVKCNAVLIGTSLLTSENIEKKLKSFRKPKVKICGVTSYIDAKNALESGTDFIGFNFYEKSPRYINPSKVKKIIEKLGNKISSVGIFVNENKDRVNEIINETGIDFLQFHGDESPDYCNCFSIPVIKVFRVNGFVPDIKGYDVFGFLFDSYSDNLYGGTGKKFDFNLVKSVSKKMFFSGGLDSFSMRDVIKNTPAYCFDVCSGVEKEKGVKDNSKVREFVRIVKEN